MTGTIITGLLKELEMLFDGTNATVLMDTQWDEEEMPIHTLPAIVLQLADSPESDQNIGGATQYQFDWVITVIELIPNAEYSPDGGYSFNLFDTLDKVRKHFAVKQWLTPEFIALATDYSFVMTLNGVTKGAKQKSGNGVVMSFNISYASVAIDPTTTHTQYSDAALEKVEQNVAYI